MFQVTLGDKPPEPFDWIHKLAELASALSWLSWPVVIITLALIFREPIGHVVRNIRTAEAPGGFKATVGEELAEIEKSVKQAEKVGDEKAPNPKMAYDEALPQLTVPGIDPFETVIKAWNSVEQVLRSLSGQELSLKSSALVVGALFKTGQLAPEDVDALTALRKFRNEIVHRPDEVKINQEQAIQYASSAERMVIRLRSLGRT